MSEREYLWIRGECPVCQRKEARVERNGAMFQCQHCLQSFYPTGLTIAFPPLPGGPIARSLDHDPGDEDRQ